MKKAAGVYFNSRFAGILAQEQNGTYTFTYDPEYLKDVHSEPVSLTLPKQAEPYSSNVLFPFFAGLLSEGEQKELQLHFLGVAENDYLARLIYSAGETIGSVTIKELK
ncbi:MAG TPA: HipA N-terminal domain-containing protein [bacterium]|nr:HipA N-terminal domain-containing protein [bacterium]HPS31321.1 HipA N-terminal domain-containing protein [bacterium]